MLASGVSEVWIGFQSTYGNCTMPISDQDLARLSKSSLDLYLKNDPIDQITQDRPLLNQLFKKKKTIGGAKKNVVEQVRKDYGSNFKWTFGEQKIEFNKRDSLEQAEFPWGRCVDALYITMDELYSNGIDVREGDRGQFKLNQNEKVQLTNLLAENQEILREGFLKSLDLHMHRDGSASTDAIVGLDTLISLKPTTGKVGNIDRAQATYWRNYANAALKTANLIDEMEKAWRECYRHGGATPDFILAGADFIDAYRAAVPLTRNIDAGAIAKVDGSVGEGARTGLYFKGKEIIWDPTFDDLDLLDAPATAWAKRCYMINTKALNWRDDGIQIITPTRPHDTMCLYQMINMRGLMSINRPNACAVLALG